MLLEARSALPQQAKCASPSHAVTVQINKPLVGSGVDGWPEKAMAAWLVWAPDPRPRTMQASVPVYRRAPSEKDRAPQKAEGPE